MKVVTANSSPNHRMERVLKMILYLHHSRATTKALQDQYEVSYRTILRYLSMIEPLGFTLEKDFEGRYFIIHDGNCPLCKQKI